MAITTHEHHGHDHDGAVGPHTHLTSIGIDIGSSTSHLMFSQLLIGYTSLHQRRPIRRDVVSEDVSDRLKLALIADGRARPVRVDVVDPRRATAIEAGGTGRRVCG